MDGQSVVLTHREYTLAVRCSRTRAGCCRAIICAKSSGAERRSAVALAGHPCLAPAPGAAPAPRPEYAISAVYGLGYRLDALGCTTPTNLDLAS
jgi:hypothetical protein